MKVRALEMCGLAWVMGVALAGCREDTPEHTACEDFVDAVASTAERCGADYDQARAAALHALGGDCARVVAVRDLGGLYSVCVPWWDNVSCPSLATGTASMPAECDSQLYFGGD